MQSLSFSSPKWNTKTVVFLGMFVAMSVVLQQFSFGPSFVRISPAFFATILMGYYFGPWTAAIGAAIADQMHVLLFMPGQNFLGFTVSAAVGAMIYGMLFHEKKVTAWRVLLGVALVIFIVNIGLNTVWLNMMGTPWRGVIWPRTLKNAVMLPIQTFLAYATLKAVERIHPRLS